MTGSSPKPSPNSTPRPPRSVQRRRTNRPTLPWMAVGASFMVYVLIGLLLSVPAPPFWIWIPAVVGTVLLILGLNRPTAARSVAGQPVGKSTDRLGLLTYVGAFLLVVALAIAANYIGGGKGFDNIRFFVAIFGLAMLTLLAVALTAAAAIVSAQTGASLMQTMNYKRSLTILMSVCCCGIFVGGLAGFLTLAL